MLCGFLCREEELDLIGAMRAGQRLHMFMSAWQVNNPFHPLIKIAENETSKYAAISDSPALICMDVTGRLHQVCSSLKP